MTGMQHLKSVVTRLRKDCPWDAAQTADSMRPYLLEECHETLEAIAEGSPTHVREELGDLLFQILLISEMYAEQGLFDLNDVAQGIADKMIRRHPHVYADRPPEPNAKSTISQWEKDKSRERGHGGGACLCVILCCYIRPFIALPRAEPTFFFSSFFCFGSVVSSDAAPLPYDPSTTPMPAPPLAHGALPSG